MPAAANQGAGSASIRRPSRRRGEPMSRKLRSLVVTALFGLSGPGLGPAWRHVSGQCRGTGQPAPRKRPCGGHRASGASHKQFQCTGRAKRRPALLARRRCPLPLRPFDRSTLRPDVDAALRQLLDEVARLRAGDVSLTVEGHTDSLGSHAYNLRLSQRRAEAVGRWLVRRAGLPSRSVAATGYGCVGRSRPTRPRTAATTRMAVSSTGVS
jgi:hypothetical protein